MLELETTFSELFDYISKSENIVHQLDQEYIQKTHIEIQNEQGNWCSVMGFITKQDKLRILEWSDGSTTKCADKHWIRTIGNKCKMASDFKVGDEIERADGIFLICLSNEINEENIFYDIQIDSPSHLYQTANGIVHHNTLLAQTLARILNVPFAMADATSLTQAGYVGEDVDSVIARLLQAAENDVAQCERGIIFIDEIDKKVTKNGFGSHPDVGGEGVQQALLKILEGSDILVPPYGTRKNNPNIEMIKINTRNILFIVGGAFIGLEKIIEKSIENTSMGFNSNINVINKKEIFEKIEPDHLINYGLIPELVGRLPVITVLEELDERKLIQVLTEPKNAVIKQFKAMFKLDGIELDFTDNSLMAIAKIARKYKTGGRALRSVIESKLLKTQFNLPDLRKQGAFRIVVHSATIEQNETPEILFS